MKYLSKVFVCLLLFLLFFAVLKYPSYMRNVFLGWVCSQKCTQCHSERKVKGVLAITPDHDILTSGKHCNDRHPAG